jgi:hypothetical protein
MRYIKWGSGLFPLQLLLVSQQPRLSLDGVESLLYLVGVVSDVLVALTRLVMGRCCAASELQCIRDRASVGAAPYWAYCAARSRGVLTGCWQAKRRQTWAVALRPRWSGPASNGTLAGPSSLGKPTGATLLGRYPL